MNTASGGVATRSPFADDAAVRQDKTYRLSYVGQEAGRFLRAMKWQDLSENTRDSYEVALARLSDDFKRVASLEEFAPPAGTVLVRDFLDKHWGEASAATRSARLAALRSFFRWAVEDGRMSGNPADTIKRPKGRQRERQAYSKVDALIDAQTTDRERVALMLLGWMGLRKNELRLLQVGDIDLTQALLTITGKGDKRVVLPIGFNRLLEGLYLYINGNGLKPDEYLLYPKTSRTRPMTASAMHRWLKRCVADTGLPDVTTHELRHAAADHLWRATGDIVMAQQLLRHESIATTLGYLHPTRDDLIAGMKVAEGKRDGTD